MKQEIKFAIASALCAFAFLGIQFPAHAQGTHWTDCDVASVRLFQQRLTVYCSNTQRFYSAPTVGGGVNTIAAVNMLTEAKDRNRQIRIRYIGGTHPPGDTSIRDGWMRPQGCQPNNCYRLTGIQY